MKRISAMKIVATILLLLAGAELLGAQQSETSPHGTSAGTIAAAAPQNVLIRHYREGEELVYWMRGNNQGWHYQIRARGRVKKDSGGFFEEFGWSNLISNNVPEALPASSLAFRQQLSLDPGRPPAVPDLSQVAPKLIGPITDMLTFYCDLWLAERLALAQKGDYVYFPHGAPNSWADGNYVLIGADSIDFKFALAAVDSSSQTATLLVYHVAPAQPKLNFPAEWMRDPVADTPNNWMEVKKNREGKFVAGAGKETFDVQIRLSLVDGKILYARLDNPVEISERVCSDRELKDCTEPVRRNIRRTIELELQP